MRSGDNPTAARLYLLPVPLNEGIVLSLGRQIVESVRRAALERHMAEPVDDVALVSVTQSSLLLRAHAPDLDSLFHSAISSDPQSLQVAVSPCCI